MAQVDFSNAVLDVNTGYKPLPVNEYIALGDLGYPPLMNIGGTSITTNSGKSIITNTPSKVSILYTGTFTSAGTEFYIVKDDTANLYWKVSNISFNSGDTYSFVIDIEVSGNT